MHILFIYLISYIKFVIHLGAGTLTVYYPRAKLKWRSQKTYARLIDASPLQSVQEREYSDLIRAS